MYYSPKAFLPESLRLLMDTVVAGSIRNYEMHILEPNWKSHNKSENGKQHLLLHHYFCPVYLNME